MGLDDLRLFHAAYGLEVRNVRVKFDGSGTLRRVRRDAGAKGIKGRDDNRVQDGTTTGRGR